MIEMKEVTFTRKELYDLVWSEPLIRLAKKYKISDNGLRKICKRMNIPLPNSGHWQKIQNGYKVQVQILPVKYNGDNMIKLTLRRDDGSYVETETSQRSLLKQEILNDPKLPMKVAERLSNPDPLVIQAQKTLLLETTRKGHNFKGVTETKPGELNIRVAPSNVTRALHFMDTFIKLLRARNHEVYSKYGNIHGVINDVEFEFSLKEKMKIVKTQDKYFNTEYYPSGVLAFFVDTIHPKEWKDGSQLIENKLPDILIYLEIKCSEIKEWRLENDRKRRIIEEEERKRKEMLARKQTEINSVVDLLNQAIRWQQTRFMREYVSSVIQNGKNPLNIDDDFQEWIDWAKKKIDWYDPFIQAKDDLLNDSDRQKIVDIFNHHK
jgi:hypothetical protein